jgi:hypothetical protein
MAELFATKSSSTLAIHFIGEYNAFIHQEEFSEWRVRSSCRRVDWMMAVGFILRGFLWAADGWAIVPLPAMKAQSRRIRSYANFVISVTPPVARVCPKNALTMR